MTSGERMVFAAEFVRALADRPNHAEAIRSAGLAVAALRRAQQSTAVQSLGAEAVKMLDDMLSNGGDR